MKAYLKENLFSKFLVAIHSKRKSMLRRIIYVKKSEKDAYKQPDLHEIVTNYYPKRQDFCVKRAQNSLNAET